MKKFKKALNSQKGFTLIELLAVIVILAIVAAIAVPAIGNIIQNQRDKAVLADASTIIAGAKLAFADGACASETVCLGTEINDYVEGVPALVAADTVTVADWSIVWTGFAEIPSDSKFTVPATGITETLLLEKMN